METGMQEYQREEIQTRLREEIQMWMKERMEEQTRLINQQLSSGVEKLDMFMEQHFQFKEQQRLDAVENFDMFKEESIELIKRQVLNAAEKYIQNVRIVEKIEGLEAKIDNDHDDTKHLKAELKEKTKDRLGALETENSLLKNELSTIQGQLTKITTIVGEVKYSIQEIKAEIRKLSSEDDSLEKRQSKLEGDVRYLEFKQKELTLSMDHDWVKVNNKGSTLDQIFTVGRGIS